MTHLPRYEALIWLERVVTVAASFAIRTWSLTADGTQKREREREREREKKRERQKEDSQAANTAKKEKQKKMK